MSCNVAELEREVDAGRAGWRLVAVADVVAMLPGFAFKSENFVTDTDAGLPLVRIRDLGETSTTTRYEGDYDEAFAVQDGDILVGMDGEFSAVRWWGGKALLNQRVLKISTARLDAMDEGYLFYRVQPALAELEQTISGTTVKHLSTKDLKRLTWHIPPLDEQRRIAEVLRSVDEALAWNTEMARQLWSLRKLSLAELFVASSEAEAEVTILGRLRPGWRIVTADDVCEAVIDCKNRTPPITDDGLAVVRTMNVRRGRFVRTNLARTDEQSFEEWTKRGEPQVGDVLITREAPIGEVCAVPNDERVCLGQRMMLYRPRQRDLHSGYLLYALQSGAVQEHLIRLAGGSTVGHVRVGDIRNLPLPLPAMQTQIAIAEAMADIDEALDQAEQAVGRLQATKAALMSDLLSGRVRVPG